MTIAYFVWNFFRKRILTTFVMIAVIYICNVIFRTQVT